MYMEQFGIYQWDLKQPFFQNLDGTRLKRRTIQQHIQQLGERANIQNVRCSPHTFRHTFAINFLIIGGSTSALKHFL